MVYTVGSLFTGVGMFDLGAVAAGLRVIWQVEYDDFCQRVLQARANIFDYPTLYRDVRDVGNGRDRQPAYADILIGGFPCQPFSTAGKRAGADDSRNMWPEFARLIGELRPRAVVLENVEALSAPTMGQPAYGLTVIGDLTQMGYDAQWGVIRASDAGAPHQRARWWCVAYRCEMGDTSGQRRYEPRAIENTTSNINGHTAPHKRNRSTVVYAIDTADESVGDTCSQFGKGWSVKTRGQKPLAPSGFKRNRYIRKPRMGRTAYGVAYRLDKPRYPAGQGAAQFSDEPARTTVSGAPYLRARLKALGNGLMPQIAYLLLSGVRDELTRQDKARTSRAFCLSTTTR